MSLILKGIDLPEKNKGLYVYIFNGKAEVVHPLDACEVMHINGEAIQVPKDHGRIGDFDLLKNMVKDSVPAYRIGVKIPTYGDMDIMDKIEFMPTILEAEE